MNVGLKECSTMPALSEDFAYIVEKFGLPAGTAPTASPALELHRGHVPTALLDFWELHGQGLMVDGMFQFCDPARLAGISKAIFGQDAELPAERCHIVGFSAFGAVVAWSEDHGSVTVDLLDGVASCLGLFGRSANIPDDRKIAISLFRLDSSTHDAFDEDGKPLFARARKKLGPLAPGQIYGFVPMLALGGPRKLDNLEIVSALEHMAMLAQAQPIKLIDTGTMAMRVVRVLG